MRGLSPSISPACTSSAPQTSTCPLPFQTNAAASDLAGVVFSDEISRLSDWYSQSGTKSRYKIASGEMETRMESGIAASAD